MSQHQKGPVPESIKAHNYPLDQREGQYQTETGVSKGFNIEGAKMPTITLETKHSGKIGSASPITVKPLREIYDVKPSNPEENMSSQFKNLNAIEHSPGAFNN